MQNKWNKIFTLIVVLLFGFQLKAQEAASITGTVMDPNGAVVPDASVTLQNPATNVSYAAVTNAQGSYTITKVRPGPGYKITFSASGFQSVSYTGLYLNVSSTRSQNARLAVGGSSQTIEVTASTQNVTLNTTDATVGNNFQVQFLNELPVQIRDSPFELFTMQPGVTISGAVTGARVDQNNVTVDGLDVNDMATGAFGAIVGSAPVDSIQEFRGVTAGQLSSSGEGGGGQYELVTRSGTNQFHGSLVEYHRDASFEANDWFNNNAGVGRPPLIRNQFGGTIGGPILRNKAFFFFDWNSRRDTLSHLVERIVPMDAFRNGSVSYKNNLGSTSTLTSAQVVALDPQGVGFSSALLSIINGRYPVANDLSGLRGDRINTAGYRFNAPYPLVENNYVGRIDYNLTEHQKIFGRTTFSRMNNTYAAIQFPGDPQTEPFFDKSYAWVVGHTWTIGANMVNQASYGQTFEDFNFPNTFNPTGVNQYFFGGIPSGGTFLSAPYESAVNAQARQYPIPVIRDDFSWHHGKHDFAIGGTFKYINPWSRTILNYNQPTVGLGGHMPNLSTPVGQPKLRPSDIATDSTSIAAYDSEYTFALGRYQSINSTYNYDARGNILPQGSGSQTNYRYYETELYFGDTWKITPQFTVSYGLRWQNYSVPYEKNGIESLPDFGFDALFNARLQQSAAGAMGPGTDCNASPGAGVPCVSYFLGGKANNAPGYFQPQNKNFAPRLAFAYMPGFDQKSVFSGGAGIIYDHTVVNAIQYQALQYSYLFQASANTAYGTSGSPRASLLNDPRFSGFSTPPPPPTAPTAITPPYTPFVSGGVPFGLANGQAFNEGVDKFLKTPYSIEYNFGFQHEFPQGYLLRTTYVGRLGRRLLGQADANQLIDFPDKASGQMMGEAFGNMAQQVRASQAVTPQPWFENILPAGFGQSIGYASNTDFVAEYLDPLPYRGDFADTIELLSAFGLLPDNVGMGSQFSEFTYYTNKGFSSYNGLLVTLHKNPGYGLQFDLNYTWSHSIDNVSIVANTPALGGYGFICDVMRPRMCRGNSDFDVSNYLNGNFIYELPFGRGKQYGTTAPFWLNEIAGGWSISGLPSWHTGNAYFATSSAFVAGYANDAPAILNGSPALLNSHLHGGNGGPLLAYRDVDAALNAYTGPVGFQVGSRNNLRGPGYFNLNLGLGKTFPIYHDRVNLKFRSDAFNVSNHPSFNAPSEMVNADITQSSGNFGVITSMTTNGPRVLQLSLRLEF